MGTCQAAICTSLEGNIESCLMNSASWRLKLVATVATLLPTIINISVSLFALEKGGIFVLLYDKRNPTFFNTNGINTRGLMEYLKSLTPQKYHDKIAHISIQELVEEISLTSSNGWINEFKIKYGLDKIK